MIGVIVPVYKTENFVAECIESILAQTYTKFRLILVDDGSPDGAGAICDQYAAKDNRITVIHQENAGVTRARARGVEEASDCEWITFVDSDDTIAIDALYTLYLNSDRNTDVVISYVDDQFTPNDRLIDRDEFVNMLLLDKSMCIALWGKLYRKDIFDDKVFDTPQKICISEDIVSNLRIAFNCKKQLKFINNKVYNHRCNPESITNTFSRDDNYEQELHEIKIEAIPPKYRGKFILTTIVQRLKRWDIKYGWCYHCKNMKYSKFYQQLKTDIKNTSFSLGIIDAIIFNCTNPVIRFIAINIKKIKNIL